MINLDSRSATAAKLVPEQAPVLLKSLFFAERLEVERDKPIEPTHRLGLSV